MLRLVVSSPQNPPGPLDSPTLMGRFESGDKEHNGQEGGDRQSNTKTPYRSYDENGDTKRRYRQQAEAETGNDLVRADDRTRVRAIR